MALNRTNTSVEIARENDDLLAAVQRSAGECPCHNCPDAAQHEHPIDKQPWLADVTLGFRASELVSQGVYQFLNTRSGPNGSGNDWRICKSRTQESFANLIGDDIDSAQVALRKRNHSTLHAEVSKDLQMLFALRHPAVISGNDEQC